MPPAVAPIVAGVAAGIGVSTGVIGGATLFGATLGAFGTGVFTAFTSFALSLAQSALTQTPKSSLPNLAGFEQVASARTTFLRQPITTRRFDVGEVITSGALTFYEATDNNTQHHMVVTLGDAPVAPWDEIGVVWLDDTPVFDEQIGGDGWVTAGKFKDKVRIKKHLGGPTQTADADLIAEIDRLDSNFAGRGVAYIYFTVKWDRSTFPNGLPKPRAICRTNTVMDYRDATRRYTPNAALALAEYMVEPEVGLNYDAAEDLSEPHTIAAANACDEIVDVRAVGHAVAAVDVAANAIDLCVRGTGAPLRLETGDRVELFGETGASAPGGTSYGSDYFAIIERLVGETFDDGGTTIALSAADYTGAAVTGIDDGAVDAVHGSGLHARIKLATTYAKAIDKTADVVISSAGSGQSLVIRTGEPRYACAAVLDTDRTPKDNVDDMLSSMAGGLSWPGGVFRINAGGYVTPTLDLDEDDLLGPLVVRAKQSWRQRFNRVKGICATHMTVGEPTDYPSVIDAAYTTADGGRKEWANLPLPATSRLSTATRVAKIALARHRREMTVEFPGTLKCLKAVPGTVVRLSNARRGWTNKTFEVMEVRDEYYEVEGGKTPPVQGATLSLKEIDAAVFDFDPATDEVIKAPQAIPAGGNPLTVAPPTGLALESGTADLDVRLDGTVFSRIRATWTAPADAYVTGSGEIDIRYKKSSSLTWLKGPVVPGNAVEAFILDMQDGVAYDVAIRSINHIGRASDTDPDPANWTQLVGGHTVAGKSLPASNVTGFSAQQTSAGTVSFGWNKITDADRNGYTIKRHPRTVPTDWDDMTLVTEEERGTEKTSESVPPGDWTFAIKAIDTSGNESTTETTANLVVVNVFDVVEQQTNAPRWPGTLTGMVRHDVSGKLIPQSTVTMENTTNLGKLSADNLVAVTHYEGRAEDLGFDADDVRVWADIAAAQAPGVSITPVARLEIDYRDDADSFNGFENWTIGNASFRHVKGRAVTEDGALLERFDLVCDVPEHTSVHKGQVITASSGSTVTFTRQFHDAEKIGISVSAIGTAARIVNYSNLTTTSVDVDVFDKDGTNVGGTVDLTATGP